MTMVAKKCRRIVSLVLALVLGVSISTTSAKAAEVSIGQEKNVEYLEMISIEGNNQTIKENASVKALLYNCLINVYSSSNGMEITFETDCVQRASAIGVKDIEIKQKVWYGWKVVATSSGGQVSNATSFMGEILYTGAVRGETYRITCTHYANADEYTEVHGELDVVFTY